MRVAASSGSTSQMRPISPVDNVKKASPLASPSNKRSLSPVSANDASRSGLGQLWVALVAGVYAYKIEAGMSVRGKRSVRSHHSAHSPSSFLASMAKCIMRYSPRKI